MITLNEVGAFPSVPTPSGVEVTLGVYLPGITSQNGYEVIVRMIHQRDRFNPDIPAIEFPLTQVQNSANTLWKTHVTIPIKAGTHFGQSGTYLYRYQLKKGTEIITTWFTDPFARMTDEVGQLSAFVTPDADADFVWQDDTWKVPELQDLVVYELQIEEFNQTFDGVFERLDYLKSLGVTCLELMPVTSLKLDFDWGYGPLHYFAPSQRWGGVQGLKRLVNECHKAGIAVILDVVYQHVDPTFPYHLVYQNAGISSPMIGGNGDFGPELDFNQEFTRDYVQVANAYWLHEYHVDGFRYDEVTDLYDGAIGVKYAKIAYDNYNESLKISRFTPSGGTKAGEYSRIIQAPEALNHPQEILQQTYSNSTWQDGLLGKVEDMARWNYVDDAFVNQLDTRIIEYPTEKTVHDIAGNALKMPVAPFQYLETHDHSQLISFFGASGDAVPFGDRTQWYKLQPFAIALYTCQGTPMLWQGQEFADNYVLPNDGNGRIRLFRNVNWEYFYDDNGAPLVRLYRILGKLRHQFPALRSRTSYYYNTASKTGTNGAIAYRRETEDGKQTAIIFLNFAAYPQSLSVPVPKAGRYREMIDDRDRQKPFEVLVEHENSMIQIDVPSHYGCIFINA